LIQAHISDGAIVVILIEITALGGRRFNDVCASVYFLLRGICSINASANLPIVGGSAWYRIANFLVKQILKMARFYLRHLDVSE
jgi:hypothetical protein